MKTRVETTLEAFAELVARLDDPFADRAAALAAAGLDEAGFARAREGWLAMLEAATDEPDGIGKRFGDAYEHALRRLEAERRGETLAEEVPAEEPEISTKRIPIEEEAPAAPAIAPAPMPPSVPEGMRHFTDVHETQPVFVAPRGKALPFDADPRLEAARRQASPPHQTPDPHLTQALPSKEEWALVPEGMRHFTDLRGTQPTAEAPRGPILPFQSPPPLTLEQYASLHVELSADPARAAVILSRYRLDEEQRRRVEAYWHERINAEPKVRAAWEQACSTARAWLQKVRGEGA
jgi:hypothetical protein